MTITPPPSQNYPDLEVGTPTVDDSSPETGASFTLSATVSNAGDAEAPATTLRYYRSTDATITTSDTEVGTDTVGALAASGTSSGSVDLTAPSTAGTYHYGACVDAVTDESDTTNNCSASVQVDVAAPQHPDLTVGSPSVDDASPETGGSFTLSATVSNDGDAEAPATTLRYYRSTDATITTSDTAEGTDAVGVLAASGTSAQSISLIAPATAGAYYYGACVDAVTDESDTTNNCSASVQVDVAAPQHPDLTVDSPSVDDASPETGGSFALSATVSNAGDAEAPATTLRYYRSTDATITTSDTEVGTDTVGALAASGTSSGSVDLTAPSTAGTYHYGACVDAVTDESDTTNNCSASVQVDVAAPQHPDLTVGSPSVDDASPETGGSFTLSATVSNDGDAEAPATTLRYYRSTDATITTSDTLVVTDAVSGLAPSTSAGKSAQLTAPSTAGTYYYGACVDAVTDESDTTNNCSASVQVDVAAPQHPDLTVGSPSVDDASPETGGSFTLSATVSNAGDAEAPATTLRYYRSTDATITTSDTEVGTDTVGALAASGTSSGSVDLTAPSTAGTYHYGACVDAVTDESDTTNNCSASVQVDVAAPQHPDLTVGSPSVDDASPETGGSFTLSATVSNDGDAEAPATTLRYYRSTDATITTSDTAEGTDAVGVLAASGTSAQSISLIAPATAGAYYYGACVDAVTDESDTTNNCSASVQVDVAAPQHPDLTVDSPSVDDASLETGGSFALSATVSNAGDAEAPATTLRYYRSTDATITTSDTEVGTDTVGALAASGTSSGSVDLTAPSTAGTYHYGACVDAVTDESDTTNNCSASVQVDVAAPQHPDLTVGSPSVDDASPETGGSFTLSATVSNDGDAEAPATTLRYYRSTDATITTSDTLVVTDAVSGLAPSTSAGKSAQLTAPSTAGTYYYGACVDAVTDESDTTNNCSASVQVTVLETQQPVQGQPDLSVGTPTADDNSPETGGTFTLSATVSNDGDGESAATTLRYYRSTDATITTSDTLVVTDGVSGLAPSTSAGKSAQLTAPSTAGTYYYGACVDAVTDESDTTNNCSASVQVDVAAPSISRPPPQQQQPDLAVVAFFLASGVHDGAPGRSLTFQARIRNVGNEVSPATTLRFYRSRNRTISTDDTLLDTVAVGTIAASSRIDSETLTLTAPSAAGTYYYGGCVDAVPRESDTTNNCSASVQVTVSEPTAQTAPDLVVRTPTVSDASVETGGTFTLSATVSNDGDGESAATTLRYYSSTDQMVTTTHTEVGTDDVGALTASGTSVESISLTARRSQGRYFYGACVDAVADESDTTNNCSAPATVTVEPPQQPEGLPSVGLSRVSSSVTEGMPARYTVTATPPPTADLVVHLQYVEFARVGDRIIYYNWPPTETTVTITGGSSSTPLTVPTIDDSDADGNSVIHAEVTSGSGYTIDTDPFKRVVYVGVEDDD